MKKEINHQRAKKSRRRRRQVRDSKDSKRSLPRSLLLDNGEADTRIHGYEYYDENLSSMDDDDRDISSEDIDNQIHLVNLDGPDPNAPIEKVKDFNIAIYKIDDEEKKTATPD